ncbi:MAG: hypothetical protein JWR09_778 [Mucilaginibacter sp.]|nr:hypothetical protein [Mucilaginibacter sp.]
MSGISGALLVNSIRFRGLFADTESIYAVIIS